MPRQMSTIAVSFKVNGSMMNVLENAAGPSINHPSFSFTRSGSALSNGCGNEQANRAWQSKDRAIVNGATETLDLYDLAGVDIGAGAGLDALGQAIIFEEIVQIIIVNENAIGAAGILEIEPTAGVGWTPIGTHTVATGGALYGQGLLIKQQLDERGFDIDDGVNHQIDLSAVGGDVTYSIYILGRTDDEVSSSSSSSSVTSSSSSSSQSSPSSSSWSSHSSSSSSSSSVTSSSSSLSVTSSSSSSSVTSSSSSSSATSSSSSTSSLSNSSSSSSSSSATSSSSSLSATSSSSSSSSSSATSSGSSESSSSWSS